MRVLGEGWGWGFGVGIPVSPDQGPGVNTAPGALENEKTRSIHDPGRSRSAAGGGSQASHLPTPTWLFAATAKTAENRRRLSAEDWRVVGTRGEGFRVWPDHPSHFFPLTWLISKQIEPVFLVSMDKKNAVLRIKAWGRGRGRGRG